VRWHTSIYHCQFTGRRGAGHRRGDAKDRMRPDHGDQALSYYSLSRRFRRRNRPIFSKFIPRQPFLATAHWSSCLEGQGRSAPGTLGLPARRVRVAMSVPSLLAFLIPDARYIAYPPGSAWNHNFRLAYGVAKTPLGTHSSYLSRSRVRGQVMASGAFLRAPPD